LGHRCDGSQIKEEDVFLMSSNGVKRRIETNHLLERNIQWKDGSTTWNKLKDMKDAYPVKTSEYAIKNGLSELAAFRWWIPYVLKKRDPITAKAKTSYWQQTHKYR
jgi:hypothetical protein